MTKKDNSMERIKQNKSIEMWRKSKQTVPDFSGKYYGKLNDKISRKSDVKISIKCNCRKKGHNREIIRFLKGKHNGKNRVNPAQKHDYYKTHKKVMRAVFAPKSRLPRRR